MKLHRPAHEAHPAMWHLVESIVNDVPHPAPASEGLLVMEILDAVYKSAELGRPVRVGEE